MSELPPIPPRWVWTRLCEVAEVKLGKMLSAKAHVAGLEQRPYLRNQNIRWGSIDVSDVKTMGFKPEELKRHAVETNDLLVCEGGEPARCAVYMGRPGAFMYQKALHRVRPWPEAADPRFLQFCLWHYASNGVVLPRPSETTIQHLPLEEMRELPVPLPPIPEQRRIVAALETHFTRLDSAVATLERVRANLKRYRAAVLRAAVDGRLGGDASRRGWRSATVGEITTAITSGSRDWSPYYGRGTATFLMAQNVRAGRLDLSFRQPVDPPKDDASRDRSQVLAGDLLVTIVGANTGNVCRVPHELPEHYVCQSVALMRPSKDVLPEYFDYFLNSPVGQRQYAKFMYGQGRPHLSFEQLRSTEVSLPPIDEQRSIVAVTDELLSDAAAMEQSVVASVVRAARMHQSVLRTAFEGRLVAQDPRDESASMLLDRIRAERGTTSTHGGLARRSRRRV